MNGWNEYWLDSAAWFFGRWLNTRHRGLLFWVSFIQVGQYGIEVILMGYPVVTLIFLIPYTCRKKPNLTYLYHTLYTLNHFLYFLTLLISNFAILPINIINNHYHMFQKLNLLFLCTTISLQQIFCFLKVYLFPLEICFHFLSISLDKKRSHVVVESMSQSGPQFLICLKYSIINK